MIKDILSSIYTKERIMGSNFEFVSNSQQLLNLINHLESQIIFAVDLEHHNIRSFQGFTCLMQITTKKRDYIVDTIILRNELHQLNKVFANENIIKLFHGSQSDMLWLQKDFGIYTVNLFDTYILAKTFRRNNSLANFLQEFCGVISDKSNQITDWRIRPLTEDQLEYARMDTHYLFWVLDELIKQFYDFYQQQKQMNTDFQEYQSIDDFFAKVFWDMQKLALETYKKPNIFSKGFQKLYQQKQLEENWTEQQLQKFKHIWEWRNLRARQFDESENYILRTRDLIEICQRQVSEKHLKDLQQKKYLDSQHFHKFIQFLQQNDYIQKTSEQVGQFVHKEQDIILDEQKEDKKNIVLEKLNQLKLRNINQQHKYDIQFKINDQTQDYQSELTQQALQTMQNQQLQKILDYSQFQLETEKKQKQENRQEDLSQSFSDSEQVIMIDDQNSNVNNKALNGIELLQNLQQLNISSGIKKNLIDNFYQNQQKQSKPSKDKEIQPDQIQQEIHNISKQIKSNNNIKFDKGLFNNKKQNTRDKSKKLRKKKKSNGKNFFQQI